MVNYLVWCYHIERQNLAVSDGSHCFYSGEELKKGGMFLRSSFVIQGLVSYT